MRKKNHQQLCLALALCVGAIFAGCKKDASTDLKADAVKTDSASLATTITPQVGVMATLPTKAEALVAMQVYNNRFYTNMAPTVRRTKLITGRTKAIPTAWISGHSRKPLKC